MYFFSNENFIPLGRVSKNLTIFLQNLAVLMVFNGFWDPRPESPIHLIDSNFRAGFSAVFGCYFLDFYQIIYVDIQGDDSSSSPPCIGFSILWPRLFPLVLTLVDNKVSNFDCINTTYRLESKSEYFTTSKSRYIH